MLVLVLQDTALENILRYHGSWEWSLQITRMVIADKDTTVKSALMGVPLQL